MFARMREDIKTVFTKDPAARIGSGSVVVKSVPTLVTVVGIPGRIVEDRKPHTDLEHGRLPDPVAEAIRLVLRENDRLDKRVRSLELSSGLETGESEFANADTGLWQVFCQGAGI